MKQGVDRNNFDLIRFVAASMVVLFHVQMLRADTTLPFLSLGDVAVQAFFVISGLLIVQSYERSSSLASYSAKRVRRIYPAYFFIVVAGSGLGLLITTETIAGYFGPDLFQYLAFNLAFLNFAHPGLPGVFAQNPLTSAVNGALWTLKIEVAFYVAVPLLVLLIRRTGPIPLLVAMYLGGAAWLLACDYLAAQTGRQVFIAIGKQLLIDYLLWRAFH